MECSLYPLLPGCFINKLGEARDSRIGYLCLCTPFSVSYALERSYATCFRTLTREARGARNSFSRHEGQHDVLRCAPHGHGVLRCAPHGQQAPLGTEGSVARDSVPNGHRQLALFADAAAHPWHDCHVEELHASGTAAENRAAAEDRGCCAAGAGGHQCPNSVPAARHAPRAAARRPAALAGKHAYQADSIACSALEHHHFVVASASFRSCCTGSRFRRRPIPHRRHTHTYIRHRHMAAAADTPRRRSFPSASASCGRRRGCRNRARAAGVRVIARRGRERAIVASRLAVLGFNADRGRFRGLRRRRTQPRRVCLRPPPRARPRVHGLDARCLPRAGRAAAADDRGGWCRRALPGAAQRMLDALAAARRRDAWARRRRRRRRAAVDAAGGAAGLGGPGAALAAAAAVGVVGPDVRESRGAGGALPGGGWQRGGPSRRRRGGGGPPRWGWGWGGC